MVTSVLLFLIAVIDYYFHRIPNKLLLLVILSCGLEGHFIFHPLVLVISVIAIALFTLVSHCGFGDSKLLIIVVNCVLPSEAIKQYLFSLMLSTLIYLLIHAIRSHSYRGDIAIAPAICGAVLAMAP